MVALAPDGLPVVEWGDPSAPIYPRSCAKPLQLAAMLDAGLDRLAPDDRMLAVAAASHSGEPQHVEEVRRLLAAADLDESALDNTPGMPLDAGARRVLVRAGHGPDQVHHNCSGKHAAMLVTCVVAGWPTSSYREPDHPLQQAIRVRLEGLAGEAVAATAVDGCGAALFAVSLTGLARAFLSLATAADDTAEARVAAAMRRFPDLVGGTGRDVTGLMLALPGLTAKDGAEGVYTAVEPALGAVAVTIEDGSARARMPVLCEALVRLGAAPQALGALATLPVLGHGEPVGVVRPVAR